MALADCRRGTAPAAVPATSDPVAASYAAAVAHLCRGEADAANEILDRVATEVTANAGRPWERLAARIDQSASASRTLETRD